MKIGVAGSLESNDAMITVKESDGLKITIKSIVYDFFHLQIEEVIKFHKSAMEGAIKC